MTEQVKGNNSGSQTVQTGLAEHVPSGMKATNRALVGDPGFDPARPRIGKFENPTLSAQRIITDTNNAYSALDQTHHSERLRDLKANADERSRLLIEDFKAGKLPLEEFQEVISRMFAVVELGGIVDPMTFAERADRKEWVFNNAKRKAKKYGKAITVISLDVTGFKSINDDEELGHSVGDSVLKKIGQGLTQASYEPIPQDTTQPLSPEAEAAEPQTSFNIIRNGGDEFLLVEVGDPDPELSKYKKVTDNTEGMMQQICSDLGINYEKHPLLFHSGIAPLGLDQDPDAAIDEANLGVNRSKKSYYKQHPDRSRRQIPR